jgi:two-component system chemotaxis response regulator CheB
LEQSKTGEARRNIVVIGASAGGVEALSALFRKLPEHLEAAVFVVLHISPYETSALHRILGRASRMRVVAAQNGETIVDGTVYVASADRHLMVDAGCVRLTRGPKESRSRPAVDVLFRSAAAAYGSRVIGVVLSGALDDGTAGLWAVKDRRGLAFAQDPTTADHGSMPQSAIEHVDVDFVGTTDDIAREIVRAVRTFGETVMPSIKDSHRAIENTIAATGAGMEAGVMNLGKISKYTCPDCHGVLIQIEEGSVVRFRCHTGHAFSMKSLIAEVNDSIDNGLWDTLRAIEERIMLLRQMADLVDRSAASLEGESFRRQADDAERRLKPLRELVLDPEFFGHGPHQEKP